jgi:hypothetical protein
MLNLLLVLSLLFGHSFATSHHGNGRPGPCHTDDGTIPPPPPPR